MSLSHQLKTNLFLYVIDLLKSNDIPYWLDTKSLLAVMGEKLGIPVSQYRDVRLSVSGEHFSKLLTLFLKLGQTFFRKKYFFFHLDSTIFKSRIST